MSSQGSCAFLLVRLVFPSYSGAHIFLCDEICISCHAVVLLALLSERKNKTRDIYVVAFGSNSLAIFPSWRRRVCLLHSSFSSLRRYLYRRQTHKLKSILHMLWLIVLVFCICFRCGTLGVEVDHSDQAGRLDKELGWGSEEGVETFNEIFHCVVVLENVYSMCYCSSSGSGPCW